jgi:hypothetical protein
MILIALLVVGRAILPAVVRGQIETRASAALGATVQVGDVDLALLAGGIALDDVAVRATKAPPEGGPLVSWKRFAVDVRWIPLLWRTIQLSTVELVEPYVALDRLQTGELNLMALVPREEPAAEPPPPEPGTPAGGEPAPAERPGGTTIPTGSPPPSAQAPGWRFGIDHLALHAGGVRFRDFLVPEAEPVLLSLPSIAVHDVTLEPELYGHPADIRMVVKLDQGALRTRARLTPREGGIAADVTVDATRLPVHRSRVYVPGVAWTELRGLLSLGLRYRLETGGRNEVSGTVGLDDVAVELEGLGEPALRWKSLGVELGKIDLAHHDAHVKSITLEGAVVPARPRGPDYLPLLATAAADAAEAPSAPAAAAAAESPPWSWRVDAVTVSGSETHLLSDAPALDVGVTLDAKSLSGPTHEGSPVKLGLAVGEGTLELDGTLRLTPLGFTGSIASARLDVPRLVDAAGALAPGVLQAAKLDADLQVALGSAAPTPGDVVVAGTAALADLWIAAEDPKEFAAGAERVTVGIEGVTVPGVLAGDPPATRPMAVALGAVEVAKLYARVTRSEAGIVLPAFTTAGPTAEDTRPPPDRAPPPATVEKPTSSPEQPRITVGTFTLAGRVDVTDRTVKPFYWGTLDPLEARLERIRVPDLEVGAVDIRAATGRKGTITITGALTDKSQVELVVKELALSPFNPYVTGMSPYSISRGSLFVTTKAAIDRARYDTTTWLTLSNFDLKSRTGQQLILEQLGIPLTVAIALLRDWNGNIDLTIPVQVDEKGAAVGLGTIVTGALVRALVGTLTSPLKVMGAVLPRGGEGGEVLAPVPIRFHAGLAALDAAGEEQVKQLATFLASRPALGVTLSAPATPADLRALREQALLAKLGPRKGVVGTLRNIGARGRIVDALEARARGEEGSLDADDTQTLDEYLADVPPPSPEEVGRLAEARLALVEGTLREQYGIEARQIGRAPASAEPVDGEPGVRVDLGAAEG